MGLILMAAIWRWRGIVCDDSRAVEEGARTTLPTTCGARSGGHIGDPRAKIKVVIQDMALAPGTSGLFRSELEAIVMIKNLAWNQHLAALAQLASFIASKVSFGTHTHTGEDPFSKAKGLILDMLVKPPEGAGDVVTEKIYRDEKLAKTTAKVDELEAEIGRLPPKIEEDSQACGIEGGCEPAPGRDGRDGEGASPNGRIAPEGPY